MEVELAFTDSGTMITCCLTPIALPERLMAGTKSSICCGRDRPFDKLAASPDFITVWLMLEKSKEVLVKLLTT